MLDMKGLFSVHSPVLLRCGEPRSRLDTSLRLGELLSWEMKDMQFHEPAWPWHFSWLIFVAALEVLSHQQMNLEESPTLVYFLNTFFLAEFQFPGNTPCQSNFAFFWRAKEERARRAWSRISSPPPIKLGAPPPKSTFPLLQKCGLIRSNMGRGSRLTAPPALPPKPSPLSWRGFIQCEESPLALG